MRTETIETIDRDEAARDYANQVLGGVCDEARAYQDADEEGEALYDGDVLDAEEIRERIQERAFSVEVRGEWHTPGTGDATPAEYRILLGTGGPASRIIGTLTQYGEPETAQVQGQDWGTPWMDANQDSDADELVLIFAGMFYFWE